MPTWVNPRRAAGARHAGRTSAPDRATRSARARSTSNADGIRIHGTENVGSIGTAASHGCIRLVRHDIEELYELVSVGTPVFIVP